MNPNTYQGHGKRTGGLQQHSIGPMMPFTVIGVTDHPKSPTYWKMMDMRTGKTGPLRLSYQLAAMDVWSRKITTLMHT